MQPAIYSPQRRRVARQFRCADRLDPPAQPNGAPALVRDIYLIKDVSKAPPHLIVYMFPLGVSSMILARRRS